MRALRLLAAGIVLFARAGRPCAWTPAPASNQPISLDRPDQALFDEAVLVYSNAVRRQHGRAALRPDPALVAGGGRSCPQHGAAAHPQPRAAGARPGATCRSACTASRSSTARPRRTSPWTRSIGCSAGRSPWRTRLQLHLWRHQRAGADAHLCEPRAEVVARWLASPKHRASLLSASFRRLGAGRASTRTARPAATSIWCRTSRTERLRRRRPGCPAVEVVVADRGGARHPARPAGRDQRVWK